MGAVLLAAGSAFLISAASAPFFIIYSKKHQFGQQIRLNGPSRHLQKAGTPTMGGLIFLFSFFCTSLWFAPRTPVLLLALAAFSLIAVLQGNQEMLYLSAILLGACLGFLLFNIHPARVFMGDVGSLALGTALAVLAIILKAELILLLVGGVFVLETLSVIIQVLSFQLTGKRVFLMSPLHHHFELQGWSEWQVTAGFWLLGVCFALLGLLDYTLFA